MKKSVLLLYRKKMFFMCYLLCIAAASFYGCGESSETGYPENRKGEDIPFGARVMRVADTFTALISDRPYRRAFDIETAMQIIIDEIDCYDMEVFLAFQRLIHEPSTIEKIKNSRLMINFTTREIMKK